MIFDPTLVIFLFSVQVFLLVTAYYAKVFPSLAKTIRGQLIGIALLINLTILVMLSFPYSLVSIMLGIVVGKRLKWKIDQRKKGRANHV